MSWVAGLYGETWVPAGVPERVRTELLNNPAYTRPYSAEVDDPVRPPGPQGAPARPAGGETRTTVYDLDAYDLGGPRGPVSRVSRAIEEQPFLSTMVGGIARGVDNALDWVLPHEQDFNPLSGPPPYELFTHRVVVVEYRDAQGTTRFAVFAWQYIAEAGWNIEPGLSSVIDGTVLAHYDVEGESLFTTSWANVRIQVVPDRAGAPPSFEQDVEWLGVVRPEVREALQGRVAPTWSVLEAQGAPVPEIPVLDVHLPDPLSPNPLVYILSATGEFLYDLDVRLAGGLSAIPEVVTVGDWVPYSIASDPMSYFESPDTDLR